jgi:anti-sigma B factor antagonist
MIMPEFTVGEQHQSGGVVVVAVSGELDIGTAPRVEDCLAYLASTGHHRLVLDTARLSFCDAAGIRVMVRARMRADERGGWLRLAAASARLLWLLDILALGTFLPAYDTVAHAIAGPDAPAPAAAADTPSGRLLAAGS